MRETDRFCSQCGRSTTTRELAAARIPERVLSRPMDQKKIAGVCAGFARYFDCDVTLMRVLWLVVAFGTGIGFIAYLVAWIAMPKDYSASTLLVQTAQTPRPV
ncbi:MAG: PspC domain-containing protein [Acidobacteriota bacterium]|nr:PspC domain-containing protein [Acidobacteriota bacterium]